MTCRCIILSFVGWVFTDSNRLLLVRLEERAHVEVYGWRAQIPGV